MSISTRNSFKDLLLWSDNLIFFGSLIFLGIFLILFIFLVIKYKLYNVCFNDCNNLLLDYKAKNFKQEILDIISLYDKKSQLYIIKIFFKNKNIPSIIEKMKKKIEKTQNPEIHDQKELINTKIEELLCNYNEKDWQICTQNRENISKIYDLTEYDSTINKNKSNSILLFFKNHLYMTIILMILCPLAIAFSFANENLEILNPTLCSGVFLFFILYFIYFLFFMIKVRKQNIKKYIIFFKKLELVRDESIVFDAKLGFTKKISVHKFTHNLTESINLASNQSEN